MHKFGLGQKWWGTEERGRKKTSGIYQSLDFQSQDIILDSVIANKRSKEVLR